MSCRLHVQKKHVIEYGSGEFNWSIEEVNSFLSTFCPSYWGNDEEYGNYSRNIEVNRDELTRVVIGLSTQENCERMFEEEDYELPKELTREQLYKSLKVLLDESDKENETIFLDWF